MEKFDLSEIVEFRFGRLKSIQGRNAIRCLGQEVLERRAKKVLIVTDTGVSAAGIVKTATDILDDAGITYVVYDKVLPDPLDTMVEEALELLNNEECDMIVGLGGGSSMDVAKSVSLMKTNPGHLMEYSRINPNKRIFEHDRILLGLIPTTAGTGSEVTNCAVITNTALNRKSNVSSDYMFADFAIVDPVLTMKLSPLTTACTAFDALTHAIEKYTVKNAVLKGNPASECLVLCAIQMLSPNIRKVYAQGDNYNARYQVSMGSHLCEFGMVGTGAAHGLANVLSKYYHIPHGASVGMLLPYVMEYNIPACPERFCDIAKAMDVYKDGMTDLEASEAAVNFVKQLALDVNLPKLSDYIKDVKEIDAFLEESLHNSCNLTNARTVTLEGAHDIFYNAFYLK